MTRKDYRSKWARDKRAKELKEFQEQKHFCKGCGVEFKPTNTRNKFHTKECLKKYFYRMYNPINNKNRNYHYEPAYSVDLDYKRDCLRCLKNFTAIGKFNRICKRCSGLI
jgi:hypothetical protein